MIRAPKQRLHILNSTVNYASDLIVRSGAHVLLDQWAGEDRPRTQTIDEDSPVSSTGAYSSRALLTGILLLILTNQPVSWAALLQLFWFQVSRDALRGLGLARTVDHGRQEEFLQYATDGSPNLPPHLVAAWQSEYQRLAKSLEAVFATTRWSHHSRRKRQRNADLKATEAALSSADREHLERNKQRSHTVCNRLIAASVDTALLGQYLGDVMFDEVVIQVAKAMNGTGKKDHLKHTGNPDADWWQKGAKDVPRWAHGLTLVMTAHRPGERKMPTVVLGMSLGRPTGGDVCETLDALDAARVNRLLPERSARAKARLAVGDMGFSYKDRLNEGLVERGYYLVQDYQANVSRRHVLAEGAVLFNGVLLCPGFEPLTRMPFDWLGDDASEEAQHRHRHREERLLAGRMHPNGRPQPAKKATRGRPRKNEAPTDAMRVEAICPAANQQCKCPIVAASMALDRPEVPKPPNPLDLPAVCRKTFVPILLTRDKFKQYGTHLYGSAEHKRLYKHFRALNEQWHSLLRANNTGGIDGNVFRTLGAERIAVIVALAVAATNLAMQSSYRLRDQAPGEHGEGAERVA